MKNYQLPQINAFNERTSIALAYFLVAAMLTCAATPFVELGERLRPEWQGGYLLPAVFVVAVEALLSWRTAKRMRFLSLAWMLYRLTELVVLVGGLKLYVYSQIGFGRLLIDLPLWPQSLANFFAGEYLYVLILSLGTWVMATYFASALGDLEGDDLLFETERDAKAASNRADARRRLIADIFMAGGVMLFLTAILRNDLEFIGLPTSPLRSGLLNVVVYFIFGLLLLAQSQFAVLRARWSFDRVPMAQNLAPRWAAYTLILLAVCAGLVIFLPTRYSLGLLDTLAYMVGVVQFLVFMLLFLLWLPIQMLINLFGFNRGGENTPPPEPVEPEFLSEALGTSVSWLEIVRSILFWTVLIGIIVFSLYYYFRQRSALLAALAKVPAVAWLVRLWNWLKGGLRRMDARARDAWRSAVNRARRMRAAVPPLGFINLRRLSPREQVRFYYLALLRRADVPRQPSQTPLEYQQQLDHLPAEDVTGLTGSFLEARYTVHDVTRESANRAKRFWEHLRQALRRGRKLR